MDAGYVMVSLGNYRGYYNSAWIGSMVANCMPFFALIGFYLVNYAVKRDFDTGVGQIIATTRVSKAQYMTGKLMSNYVTLLLILAVITVMTVIMFFMRGETRELELGKLLLPLLLLTAPTMFCVASIALFFDSLTSLNRGMLNIIYFFLWTFLISISLFSPLFDVFGMTTFMNEIKNVLPTVHPDWDSDFGTGILIRDSIASAKVFVWEGMDWSKSILMPRIYWMIASFGLVLLASLRFNRFDIKQTSQRRINSPLINKKKEILIKEDAIPSHITLQNFPLPEARFNFLNLLRSEMKLMLKGNSPLWLISTLILLALTLFTPLNFAYKVALPLIWYFQILVLSQLGSREIKNRCNEYIFSAAFPLQRQLPAILLAAIFFMLILATPMIFRLIFNGNFYGVYSILVGALSIATLAISLGILTRGSKLFEVLFTIIVYGHFNKVPYFDFTGGIEGSQNLGVANYTLLVALILILLAFSVRKRQITDI